MGKEQQAVLSYVDKRDFVPVRFGLKHLRNGQTTLYMIVDQNKIALDDIREIKNDQGRQDARSSIEAADNLHRLVNISILQIIRFVNTQDLLRYMPDQMLSEKQHKAKWDANPCYYVCPW